MPVRTDSQSDKPSFPPMSVLIPDGDNYDALKVLRCLGQAPAVTSYILSRVRWPMSRFSRYCKKSHYYDCQQDANRIDSIKRVVQQKKIDVLLPVTMKGAEFLSLNRETISQFAAICPIPKYEMLKIAQDKWAFHCFAEKYHLPVPSTILVAEGKRIVANSAELDSIEYPTLLKPTTEMGGRGIVKIDSPSEFYHLVEQKNILHEGRQYILQSYIPGIDYCLGVLCKAGRISAFTLQRNLIPSENNFSYQNVMDFVNNDSILNIGTQLISTMAWDGIAFIDFRLDEREHKTWLIEVNPRLGRALFGSLIAGVNFPLILCLTALGISCTITQQKNVRYAHPSAYVNLLKSRLLGRPVPIELGWRETGWRFSLSDPLPDLVEALKHLNKMNIHIWKKKKN